MNALVEIINRVRNKPGWYDWGPEIPIMKNIANLDVLGTNNIGDTQLHMVLTHLKVTENVVKEILDLGAPVNAANRMGETPLHIALIYMNCKLEIVKLLVSRGANVCKCDYAGFGPLIYALKNDNCSTDLIEFLCDRGADVKHIDEAGCTMLHYALRNKKLPKKKLLEVVQILLNKGVSPYSVNNDGDTALFVAVSNNRKDVVDLLLKIPKIKIDFYNFEGFTPLHLAVMNSKTDPGIIKLLIKSGASIHKKTHEDQQCLHLAAQHCNPVHIKILLDYGARVNVCDKDKRTPLYIAVKNIWNCNTAALKLLLDAGALIFQEKPKNPHEKWLLTNSTTNNALHEAIRAFDSTDKKSLIMPQMLLLLKYAILEDTRICFRTLEVDCETKHMVLDYSAKCMEELKTICIAPKVTLAQFILQNSLQAISQSPTDDILEILTAHPYPIYREVVAGLMDKDDLREGLQQHPVYALSRNKPEERVVLDYDTLCGVMTYLADEDLTNLLLSVFEPKRSPVPQVKSCYDCGLYDEIEVESERFRKRARKA